MLYESFGMLLAAVVLGAILGAIEIGRRAGARRIARNPGEPREGTGAIEGALFGLLGLLVAFTFSGGAARFDVRRHLIIEETNAIGTAYLRLDLIRPDAQAPLRDAFRRYLDSRIATYRALPDLAAATAILDTSVAMQGEIWRRAVAEVRADGAAPGAAVLLLPALNSMFDITTTRTWAGQMHPPWIIYAMLFIVAVASAMLAGYSMGGTRVRRWLHMACFAAALSLAVYVILDMEYPRLGIIRVDAFDQALVELRKTMR